MKAQFNSLKIFKTIKQEYLALIVFAALVFAFYGNTLFNGFVLDDRPVVEENIYIRSLEYAPKVVTGCIWESALGACKGISLHYRPIHSLSYLLTYQISSSPWIFHLVNLLYFLAAVFLAFIFIKILTKNFFLSFFAALIFLVHPINSEAVNWVSAVSELTFAIFILLTLIFYAKYRETDSTQNLSLTVLFYFLTLLSKEPAVFVVLPAIIALDIFIFKMDAKKLLRWDGIKNYLLFLAPTLVYFFMRQAVLGGWGGLASQADYLGGFSLQDRAYYFFWLFFQYIKTLIFPYPLIFIHELEEKAYFLSSRFFILAAAFLSFAAALYFFIKKGKGLIVFSLFWIFILIVPMLVFYNVAGENIFAERYLFVPSIGFALFIAYPLAYFYQAKRLFKAKIFNPSKKSKTASGLAGFYKTLRGKILSGFFPLLSFFQPQKTRQIIVLFLLAVFIAASWLVIFPRNSAWKDNPTFLKANLAMNPDAHKLREYLADELRGQGNIEAAKLEYEELIRRNAQSVRWQYLSHAYNNLGDYYRQKKDLEKAEEYYKKSIEESKDKNYKAYNNLGAFYVEDGKHLKALVNFCKALQIDPQAPEPQQNFNRVASMISSVDDENFLFLYMDFTSSGAFQASAEKKIQFKKQNCSYGACAYSFSTNLQKGDILFPFLIMGKAFPEELIRIKDASFNPQNGEITLTVDELYKDRLITFLFPACSGEYYQSEASSVNSAN